MRTECTTSIGLALCIGVLPQTRVSADLTVSEWGFDTGVIDDLLGIRGSSFRVVQNPFRDSHAVTLGQSSAAGAYDFAWSETGNTGRFRVDWDHACRSPNAQDVRCLSSGFMIVEPTVDLLARFTGQYAHVFTGHESHATFGFSVQDLSVPPQQMNIFSAGAQAFSFLHPWTGTLRAEGGIVLPAGHRLRVNIGAGLDHYRVFPGRFSSGLGFTELLLTDVPEPASAALLLPSALFLSRRIRRHFHR